MARPQSALADVLTPGLTPRAGGGAVNLVIQEQPNVTQLQIIACKNKTASLAKRVTSFLKLKKPLGPQEGGQVDDIHIYATAPHEYWVFSAKHDAPALEQQLTDALGDTASLFDQTHGRFIVRISGEDATRLLAKGVPLDLDEGAFPAIGASNTTLDHIPVLVARRAAPVCFELSAPRSYAGSLVSWFSEAAREFGYSVQPSQGS